LFRFIEDVQKKNRFIPDKNMSNHPCPTAFSFVFGSNGKAYFIAVIAQIDSLFGCYFQAIKLKQCIHVLAMRIFWRGVSGLCQNWVWFLLYSSLTSSLASFAFSFPAFIRFISLTACLTPCKTCFLVGVSSSTSI
jgi:hypothetical protein